MLIYLEIDSNHRIRQVWGKCKAKDMKRKK
jgi:hypothetical protein